MDRLTIEGLKKRYGAEDALSGPSLSVDSGELVGVIGPNGCGKSTLMHCVTGIVEPDGGDIRVGASPRRGALAKDLLGFVPDDLPLPEYLSGAEYIDLVRNLRKEFDLAFAGELLELLGIADEMGKLVGQYSHGMKKKLQLATVFAQRPEVLILDEPFSGLDPRTHLILDTLIHEFKDSGGAVLISTHDLFLAQRYFDRIYILAEGQVIESGNPLEVCRRHGKTSLIEVFIEVASQGDDPKQRAQETMRAAYSENP